MSVRFSSLLLLTEKKIVSWIGGLFLSLEFKGNQKLTITFCFPFFLGILIYFSQFIRFIISIL